MSLRFFNDFDDLFANDVTFSLLPLRMADSDNCKGKKACRPVSTALSTFTTQHRLGHLDVIESDTDCTVTMDLPGVAKEDVQVHFDDANRMLTVEAERQSQFAKEGDEGNDRYFHQERYFGKVHRSVMMPENIDGDSVQASLDNGVLRLVFGKRPEKETRKRISIN